MANLRGVFLAGTPHWRTPAKLYADLDAEFHFDLDPCPIRGGGGLVLSWAGRRVYCNPPYGRGIIDWVTKAREAALAVFLLPARTDTEWFQVCLREAREIRFIRGRLHFGDAKGAAPFPSIIVIFSGGNDE